MSQQQSAVDKALAFLNKQGKKQLANLDAQRKKQLAIINNKVKSKVKEPFLKIQQEKLDKQYQEEVQAFRKRYEDDFDRLAEEQLWATGDYIVVYPTMGYRYDNHLFALRPCIETPKLMLDNEEKLHYLHQLLADLLKEFPEYNEVFQEHADKGYYQTLGNIFQYEHDKFHSFLVERKPYLRNNIPYFENITYMKLDELANYFKVRLNYLDDHYTPCSLGLEGEREVNKELDMHHNLINLKNIRVEVDGNSVENDNIILSPYGIFSLEVKNYGSSGNYSLLIEADGRWNRKYRNGETAPIDSASSQSTRHVAYLNRLINTSLNRDLNNFIDVKDVIVISNDTVTIENHSSNQTILRKSDVYNFIRNNPVIFTQEELLEVKQILESNNLGPKKYEIMDFKDEIITNIKDFRKNMALMQEYILSSYQEFEELKVKYNQQEQESV